MKIDVEEIKNTLRELVPPASTIYTILISVNRTGTSRHLQFIIPTINNGKLGITNITWYIAQVLNLKLTKDRASIISRACGTDAGYEIVYHLGTILYPKGGDIKDGGYLLRHEWISR